MGAASKAAPRGRSSTILAASGPATSWQRSFGIEGDAADAAYQPTGVAQCGGHPAACPPRMGSGFKLGLNRRQWRVARWRDRGAAAVFLEGERRLDRVLRPDGARSRPGTWQ